MGSQAKYPYSPTRPYTPPEANVDDLKRLRTQIGVARNVIVTPTPYGFDNRSTVDAVVELGPTARGVVLLPPDVSDSELARLEAAGHPRRAAEHAEPRAQRHADGLGAEVQSHQLACADRRPASDHRVARRRRSRRSVTLS